MSTERYPCLYEKISEALSDKKKSDLLLSCVKRDRDTRVAALEALPGGAAFRDDVRAAKERCIEGHPRLKQQFIENARKRGVSIVEAKNGADVINYCLDLVRKHGVKTLGKSKSLTTEEIELNYPLAEAGVDVVETDLGELIIQLVDEKPFHLVFPAVHKMAPDVAKIFSEVTGQEVADDIPSIMKVVRKYLRPIFLACDIGMTGANIGIAETGGICIETNEGNGRLISSIGKCHICVVGMEKIVETGEDALLMIMAHPVSASGQLPTTYVTWMHGRSPLGDGDTADDRESHIIILDNGRTEMRDDPEMREALYCIRCGACMNICSTYGAVGGHTFGHIYPGPMGICWTAGVHGLDIAGDFAQLCVSCGLCKEICPAKINMPHMIAEIKHRDAQTNGHLRVNKVMMAADKAAKFGSRTAPIANTALNSKPLRKLMEKSIGLSADRKLPSFSSTTFMQHFSRRTSRLSGDPVGKVVFFVDVYANYNKPELGLTAVDILEDYGCQVIVPDQGVSGYPSIAYGGMDSARKIAQDNVDKLVPWIKKGYQLVAIEPTATYALAVSYPTLLRDNPDAELLAKNSHELFEYVLALENPSAKTLPVNLLSGKRFGFHCPCHQRPLGSGNGAMEWVRHLGAEIELIETGTCCGMGGTFGLKAGLLGHQLSNAIGEPLFKLFRESGVEAIVTESSVCSIQLAEGTGLPVYHPLELLNLG